MGGTSERRSFVATTGLYSVSPLVAMRSIFLEDGKTSTRRLWSLWTIVFVACFGAIQAI